MIDPELITTIVTVFFLTIIVGTIVVVSQYYQAWLEVRKEERDEDLPS